MKILVVDDSILILKAVGSYIRDMADVDEVILCSDSLQAVDIIKQQNIDIVIMDVVMPEKTGIEVLTEIRRDPNMKDIQVIMLTSEPKYFKECFSLGSNDFINKPFDPVELQSRLTAAIVTRKNITIVHEMNARLIEQNDELLRLNQLIKETQVAIIQNEKMASIGELAAGVAHEINNPLGFVKSNIETMNNFIQKAVRVIGVYRMSRKKIMSVNPEDMKTAMSEGMKNIIEAEEKNKIDFIISEIGPLFSDLQEGIDRVAKIVTTLTRFAHISSEETFVLNNVNSIIEEALLIIKNEYKYKINIHTNLDKHDEITCNRGQVEQVLINTLINAVQAIKSQNRTEKGNIYIDTRHTEKEYKILIYDDGPGIPENLFIRIFDPFFTTKDVGKGTGLGLSISYDIIVNKHKGHITALNRSEGGAMFKITLPAKHLGNGDAENEYL